MPTFNNVWKGEIPPSWIYFSISLLLKKMITLWIVNLSGPLVFLIWTTTFFTCRLETVFLKIINLDQAVYADNVRCILNAIH